MRQWIADAMWTFVFMCVAYGVLIELTNQIIAGKI